LSVAPLFSLFVHALRVLHGAETNSLSFLFFLFCEFFQLPSFPIFPFFNTTSGSTARRFLRPSLFAHATPLVWGRNNP